MLLKVSAATVFTAALLMASGANAALIHDYELNGDLNDSVAGGTALTGNGATQTAAGLDFAANQGPSLLNAFSNDGVYSIDMRVALTTPATGYEKLIDFNSLNDDVGFYDHGGPLQFYDYAQNNNVVFTPNTFVDLVLTRDAGGLLTGYVNGVANFSVSDSVNKWGVIVSSLDFFQDDGATGHNEAGAGTVDYIRIYDTALNGDQVARLTDEPPVTGGVPEPASWALMIVGFGAAGSMLRRRRGLAATA